jgi:hypothetical protein
MYTINEGHFGGEYLSVKLTIRKETPEMVLI